ncbi:hypothetical protein EDC04DRAFT_2921956 [Pisolithus marmoratus]|nr:hypothetical protein EDC04DRAFT_2921956 [Pisolithus marmoratus]
MNSPTPSRSGGNGSLEDMLNNLLLSDPEIDSVTWQKESLTDPHSISLSHPQSTAHLRTKATQATLSQAQPQSSYKHIPACQSHCYTKSQMQPTNNAFILFPPNPLEIKPPTSDEVAEGFYVITVGQEVGIFFSWLDASEHVTNVPGAQHKCYHTFKDAL